MITSRTVCRYLKLDFEPFPKKIQAGRDLVKNGENVPKIVTEDIRNDSPRECIKIARLSKGNRGKIIDLIRGTAER